MNSGTFDFNGNSAMMGGLAVPGGIILNNGGGASTITFGFNNDSPTYSGTITDHSTGNGTMAVVKLHRYRDPQRQQQLQRRHNDQRGHDPGGQLHGVGFGGLTMNGGTLNMNAYNLLIANLSGNGGAIQDSGYGAVTLTVGSDNTSTTYGGLLLYTYPDYALSLTKVGTGCFTLTVITTTASPRSTGG